MANFGINISEKPSEQFKVKNTEINKENCNKIEATFNVQILNEEILPENTIELLNSYSSPNNWSHMHVSNISYSDENKFYLYNNTTTLQPGTTYGYNVSGTNINENVINFKVRASFDSNDFSSQTIDFKINFQDDIGNVYDYQYLTLSINPSLCAENSNPKVTQINTGISDCDSQYIALQVENTPYSQLTFKYKTLNNGSDSYVAILNKLSGFDEEVIYENNLIFSETYRSIITQIDETGINYYRIKLCANPRNISEIENKCSIIINIYDINGLEPIYSYILTDTQ